MSRSRSSRMADTYAGLGTAAVLVVLAAVSTVSSWWSDIPPVSQLMLVAACAVTAVIGIAALVFAALYIAQEAHLARRRKALADRQTREAYLRGREIWWKKIGARETESAGSWPTSAMGSTARTDIHRLHAAMVGELERMKWWQFEIAVADLFELNGYETRVGRGSKDGGVDVTMRRRSDARLEIVQCKQYKEDKRVGVNDVLKTLGAMMTVGATHGWIVTTSGFTREALARAAGQPITLAGPEEIADLVLTAGSGAVNDSIRVWTKGSGPGGFVREKPY